MPGLVMSPLRRTLRPDVGLPELAQQVARQRPEAKPDIALVVIGAWDLFDVQTAQGKLAFRSPEWESLFLTNLRSGLAAIRESGAQIALADLPATARVRPTRDRPATGR
jgi:hypothetical protein